MDHDPIVEQLLDRCKCFLEYILQASDLHRVATASLAIFAQLREVAGEVLQAKISWRPNSSSVRTSRLVARIPARDTSTPGWSVRRPCLARCTSPCAPSSVAGVAPPFDRMTATWGSRRWGTSLTMGAGSTRLWSLNCRIVWPMTCFNGARGWP
jgi:hypothetical protein